MYMLPELPYSYDSLEPFIDAKTMEIHLTKHHQSYVNNLNDVLKNAPHLQKLSLIDLLKQAPALPHDIRNIVINNGGGHSNHMLFWKMMTPSKHEQSIPVKLEFLISNYFGSYEAFKVAFRNAAVSHFGSGWCWLVICPKKKILSIMTTINQESPYMYEKIPLLGIDVWEHAYYLLYQNKRSDYIHAWFSIVNWHYVFQLYQSVLD